MTLGSLRDIYVWKNTHFSEVEESECSIKSGSPTIRLEQKVVFDRIDLILFIYYLKNWIPDSHDLNPVSGGVKKEGVPPISLVYAHPRDFLLCCDWWIYFVYKEFTCKTGHSEFLKLV